MTILLEDGSAAGVDPAAGFLSAPALTDAVRRLYAGDLEGQGYVARLTRLWSHSPGTYAALGEALGLATAEAGLTYRQRAVLVSATASAMSDAYCSMAWGAKLASAADPATAAEVVGGGTSLDPEDAALAAWARKVVRDPNATTAADIEALRTLGFDDRQVFALTVFVALRLAFSTVNDALGAAPDLELAERVPAEVRERIGFGRAAE